LEHDEQHCVLLLDGVVCGTATLKLTENGLKMRQVAVDPSMQGHGIGRQLVKFCEAYAGRNNLGRLYCHARDTAIPFYERCGWISEGPVFTEVDIPHRICAAPAFAKTADTPQSEP